MKRIAIAALLAASMPSVSAGQVGYEPGKSPYRDLERHQEISILSGYFAASRDAANVAPRSGPLVGLRYQWHPGGPANLTADFARVGTDRRVLDPDKPTNCAGSPAGQCKLIDEFRWPLYIANIGLAMNLTGSRSFYRLVPEVRFGTGLVTDFHTASDVGDFKFGTRFAFNFGGGIRWLTNGPLQLRLDYANHLYTVKYPVSYFVPAPDTTLILPRNHKPAGWYGNSAFTLGFSFLFDR